MTREEIIAWIKAEALQAGGSPPGRRTFSKLTGLPESAWCGRIWANWSDAVAEAGFRPNVKNSALPKDYIFASLAEACRRFGHFPSMSELRLYANTTEESPSHNTFVKPFGSVQKMRESFGDFVVNSGSHTDLMQLVDGMRSTVTEVSAEAFSVQDDVVEESKLNDGWVYMLRSGQNYKIGRSEDLEKRIKQVSVALPDKITLEHAIKTDDPSGIETYWHRRFANFRVNGEWFKLDKKAIAAFRRRKFQ